MTLGVELQLLIGFNISRMRGDKNYVVCGIREQIAAEFDSNPRSCFWKISR